MVKARQRRHSQNGQLMRRILMLLREYEPDEVELLCRKYCEQVSHLSSRSSRRRARRKKPVSSD
ncbi:MAG: hypothetical protein ACYTGH_08790 [Planctomycetota bacterium]|jgi:hypothetical protein